MVCGFAVTVYYSSKQPTTVRCLVQNYAFGGGGRFSVLYGMIIEDIQVDSKLLSVFPWPVIFKPETK
jgi:hypothetical protein